MLSACLLLFTVLVADPQLGGANSPSLDVLIETGRAYNVQNIEQQGRVEQAQAEHQRALGLFLPSFNASATYQRNQYEARPTFPNSDGTLKTAIIQPKDLLEARLNVEVPLIDVSSIAGMGTANARRDAARLNAAFTQDDVSRQIIRAYYQYTSAFTLLESTALAQQAAEDNLALVSNRANAGLASPLDVDRAQSEVQRAKQAAAEASAQRAIAVRTIHTLTGIVLEGTPPDLPHDLSAEAPLEQWLARIDESNAVRASNADANAAHNRAQAAWMRLVPRVAAVGSEVFTNAPGFLRSPYYAVGVTARWRLDADVFSEASVQDANARIALAQARRVRENNLGNVQDTWIQIEALRARCAAAEAQFTAAERASRFARDRYTGGTATQLEVVQADRDRFAADVARVQAWADLAYARSDLRLLTHVAMGAQP